MSHLEDYHDDCVRIQKLAKEINFDITLAEACLIWENYSEDYCAGWMGLDCDANVKNVLKCYMLTSKRKCPHCGQSLEKPNNG